MHIDSLHRRRLFFADTTALVIFFTFTGVINERFIAGMPWPEVAVSRMFGAPLMVLTARPYGIWRDAILARWTSADSPCFLRFVLDMIALATFQVPIYAFIIWVGGAREDELIKGVLGATIIMLFCGRPFGLWLDLVRRLVQSRSM